MTATWTLPPGVEAAILEVATSPSEGTDGYFFDENLVIFDTLEDAQTNYISTETVPPGTYYLHVGGFDAECLPCPIREFTQTATFSVENEAPSISSAKFDLNRYKYVPSDVDIELEVCDEGGEDIQITALVERLVGRRVVARGKATETSYASTSSCDSHWIGFNLKRKFYGDGRLIVSVTVTDPYGVTSEKVSKGWPAPW